MWQNISFEDFPGAFFQYKFDNDYFYVKCEIYAPSFPGGRVCACSDSHKLNLGTLGESGALYTLDKSYPLTFLRSRDIDANTLTRFCIELSDGTSVYSRFLSEPDASLLRAQKALGSIVQKQPSGIAMQNISRIHTILSGAGVHNLPFDSEFTWYLIDDIKQTFSLSSVKHIVYTTAFMQNFACCGHWFFGVSDKKELFAVCILSSTALPNPMTNALDCDVTFPSESSNKVYHVVGIGLYDDGQYFYKVNS